MALGIKVVKPKNYTALPIKMNTFIPQEEIKQKTNARIAAFCSSISKTVKSRQEVKGSPKIGPKKLQLVLEKKQGLLHY